MYLRDHQYDKLIEQLIKIEQKGVGFIGEGSCEIGHYIFGATSFFIPLKSTPSLINLSEIEYTNCQNLIVAKKNRYGFVVRAEVLSSGLAYCNFNWEIVF